MSEFEADWENNTFIFLDVNISNVISGYYSSFIFSLRNSFWNVQIDLEGATG